MAFQRKSGDDVSGVSVQSSPKQKGSEGDVSSVTDTSESKPKKPQGPKLRSVPQNRPQAGEENTAPRRERGAQRTRSSGSEKNNNLLFIGAGVAALVVVIIAVVLLGGNDDPPPPPTEPQQVVEAPPPLSPGAQLREDLVGDGIGVGGSPVPQIPVTSDTMLRDIDGHDLPEMWEYSAFTWIHGFVTFEKRRAILDSGSELFWLDGDFEGTSLRIVVPYAQFRNLPERGTVVAAIEFVETTDGQRVITFARFDVDAHQRMIGGRW